MAFSNLNALTLLQYQAYQRSPDYHPIVLHSSGDPTISGNPDPDVSIELAGWVGDNTLLFSVTNSANSGTGVRIDTDIENTIGIDVLEDYAGSLILYYSVDTGTDNRTSNWMVTYEVKKGKTKGTWVFTKGKTDDDILPG